MKQIITAILLAVTVASCAHARHVAVVGDVLFSQAVFAIDDAERAACKSGAMSPAACAAADPKVVAALKDVQAVTAAIQATPKNVAVPKNLPDLLTDLTSLQAVVAPLASAPGAPPAVATVGGKVQAALNQAIAVLNTFTGGK